MFSLRMDLLQKSLDQNNVDVSLITNEDSIYYFTGYYDYLHIEFGRPTILIVIRKGESILITPSMENEMAEASSKVDRIETWNDGLGEEWREFLPKVIKGLTILALEKDLIPQIILRYVLSLVKFESLIDINSMIAEIRMIKSEEEIDLARHAAKVGLTMMEAGADAIGAGIPEYEVALAISEAGTKKAAKLLTTYYQDKDMSPNTHFLQIMASGNTITKTHHRASTKIIRYGEPVFLCFCGMTNFHRFKLGFDRTFWLGEIVDPLQEKIYNVALTSQQAALNAISPGVTAESVHKEYAKIIRDNGYDYPFRCGRATGFSFLEKPQLVTGDKTILKPGMVLAIDGSVTVDNFRAQVGDSIIITKDGYEIITHHPKKLTEVII